MRSIILCQQNLLTTFADITIRLNQVLNERECIHIQDETPSPNSLAAIGGHSRRVSNVNGVVRDDAIDSTILKRIAQELQNQEGQQDDGTFASVPAHLTKFAEHVDAMAEALNDAQEQLAAYVEGLMNQPRDAGGCTILRCGHMRV